MFPYLSSLHDFSSTFITPDSGLSAKLEYREHLTYFLYGAMIFMALKKWKRALLFLEIVIMSPIVNNISKIQVDAYKKWVLVSLLYKGHVSFASDLEALAEPSLTVRLQPSHLPKTLSQQATKQYHATSKAYDGLADVFKDGILNEESVQRLIEEVTAGEGWWDPVSHLRPYEGIIVPLSRVAHCDPLGSQSWPRITSGQSFSPILCLKAREYLCCIDGS